MNLFIGNERPFASNARMLQTEFLAARDQASKALLIVLHGLGDSAAGFHWLPSALNLPGLNYLLVNAPDTYFTGFSWYDFTGDEAKGIVRSRGLLMALLEKTRRDGFASEQTMLFGFSQGCLMTIDIGFRWPERLAGLVGVSGYVHRPDLLLEELSPAARSQRMLFTHGTYDTLVPCAQVRGQVKLLTDAGLNIKWCEFPKAHTIEEFGELPMIRDFIRGSLGWGEKQ